MTRQRGSILIYTMLTMSAMLAIGITLNGIFVSRLHAAGQARNATVALYAADSGTELCLYAARASKTGLSLAFASGATMTVNDLSKPGTPLVTDCQTLGTGSLFFQVVGAYLGATRALEISQ